MKKNSEKHIFLLLWSGLVLVLLALIVSLSDPVVVFAAEESLEEQLPEVNEDKKADAPESKSEQNVSSSDAVKPATAESETESATEKRSETAADEPEAAVPKETTEAVPEKTTEAVPEKTTEAAPEETTEAAPEKTTEAASEKTTEAAPEEASEVVPEETTEAESEETTKDVPEESTEATPEETSEVAEAETPEAIPEEDPVSAQEEPTENTASETEPVEAEEAVSEDAPEIIAEETPTAAPEEGSAEFTEDPQPAAVGVKNRSASNSSASGTIHIGNTSFNAGDEVSSSWVEGKGWKNVAGQYVAMVDYDGREAEISSEEDVLTLAVAGVNRIKALKGDCSYQIIGTGIVLLDGIELADGKVVTLHPNTALYQEGSAAVFLLQDDDRYLLINGDVTGILDEEYVLDDVHLVLPKDSCLKIGAMTIRKEVWTPEGADAPETDISRYTADVPQSAHWTTHDNATISVRHYAGNVVIKKNSSLTVEDGASVQFVNYKDIITSYYSEEVHGDLIVEGQFEVNGIVENGNIDIRDGGTLTGTGTIHSSNVHLQPAGNLSNKVLLDSCSLTINGNGSKTRVSTMVRDSLIFLRGSGIDITDLRVSGSNMLCIDTEEYNSLDYRVGNITLSYESHLDILANDHEYADSVDWHAFPYRLLEDCSLEIYGKITGGSVNVLSGFVKYTGIATPVLPSILEGFTTSVLPVVPEGFASRVLIVNGTNISSEKYSYPLNMTAAEASARAAQDEIPVMGLTVMDTFPYDDGSILARKWVAHSPMIYPSVSRENDKNLKIPELLKRCGILTEEGQILSSFHVAVESIYSDFSRNIQYYGESYSLETKDVIMFRVLQCYWDGGAGGSSITHADTSFTGNGELGGLGTNTVKSGTGSVVYGKKTDPEPEDPKPEDSKPEDPKPEDPKPEDPKPEDPKPEDPKPEDPEPAVPEPENPEPAEPDPTDPDPEDPKPVTPKPVRPKPAAPKSSKTKQADPEKSLSSVTPEEPVITVSLLELKEKDPAEDPENDPEISPSKEEKKIPQIWQLTVTKKDVPVTDLTEDPVKVGFEFTVPEDWGDPEELVEESLYAVFVDDEGKLTAYEAHYDPETGEIWFETEQTGYFVIVRFTYEKEQFENDLLPEDLYREDMTEEELFAEYFYRALAELEEIQAFLDALREAGLLTVFDEDPFLTFPMASQNSLQPMFQICL